MRCILGKVKTLGLSSRAGLLKPSPTLAITARAKALMASGEDVISLAAGEPDFDTPGSICDAAVAAIRGGLTKYTPTAGLATLRQAICQKLLRENRIEYTPEQVVVSCGAKHSVYNALMSLVGPGDEVILVAPYWMTYAEQVALAGASCRIARTSGESSFVPSIEALREQITDRTRAIIINSPCNPTGAVFPRQTLKEIAALALRHGFWIIADEIYERLTYGAEHVSIASLGRDVAEQTVTINGVSKTYSMTGWRIGYAAAPLPVARAMCNLQDQVTSNPTSFAQAGAIAALEMPSEDITAMRATFEARRDLLIGLLEKVPGIRCSVPSGAFYVLADVSAYCTGRAKSDADLAEYLLDEAKVAVIPGSVFEAPGHIRISYASSESDLRRGIERLAAALEKLSA